MRTFARRRLFPWLAVAGAAASLAMAAWPVLTAAQQAPTTAAAPAAEGVAAAYARNVFKTDSPVACLAHAPDGKALTGGLRNGKLIIWDLQTKQPRFTIDAHKGSVNGLAYTRDGTMLATGGGDGAAKLWNPATGKAVATVVLPAPPTAGGEPAALAVTAVAFTPDGKRLAVATDDGSVRLYDVATRKEVKAFSRKEGPVRSVAFHPNAKLMAVGYAQPRQEAGSEKLAPRGRIVVWDLVADKPQAEIGDFTAPVKSVAFTPDGKLIAGAGGAILTWDVETGTQMPDIAPQYVIVGMAFSADSELMAYAGAGQVVTVRDISIGADRTKLGFAADDRVKEISCVTFSPNGRTVAAAGVGEGGVVKVFDVPGAGG